MTLDQLVYVEEPEGPGIPELPSDVQFGGAPAQELPEAAQVYPGWEEASVRQFLLGGGAGMHMLIGAGENDWLMTEQDLARIAPPLTRMLNRYEPTLRASAYADPLLVAHGFALYGWRSALERARARRDEAQLAEQEAAPVRAGYTRPMAAASVDVAEEDDGQVLDELTTDGVFAPNAAFPAGVKRRA